MSDVVTTSFTPQTGNTRVVFLSQHTVSFKNVQYYAKLRVAYRPEKLLIERQHYQAFIKTHLQKDWPTPENLLDALVNQLYDALVPYKVDARLTLQDDTTKQTITARKQQPRKNV